MLLQGNDAEKEKLRASLGSAILAERPNVKASTEYRAPAATMLDLLVGADPRYSDCSSRHIAIAHAAGAAARGLLCGLAIVLCSRP